MQSISALLRYDPKREPDTSIYQPDNLISVEFWNGITMKCERCGADTYVERHEVDGFTGYLCDSCRDAWDEISS